MKNQVPKRRRLALPAMLCCLPAAVGASPLSTTHTTTTTAVHDTMARPAVPVSGRVVDENGQGMPGVTVLEKGTTNGVTTSADGSFTLNVASGSATLVFSFVGYTSREVAVANQSTINISLAPDTEALNEVVVVGYLTQERQNVTGSVASVGAQEVRRAPVATVSEAIQGRLPGVQVANSGQPGQAPVVNIRGIGSITSGSGPLYIIDGLWVENIRDFNPQDAESVQVLKDAASLAPYGSRGANGVIIITTRRGKSGTPAINFNGYAGVQNIAKTYDLMNSEEWAVINRQAYENAGRTPQPYALTLPRDANGQIISTDWQDEFFKQGSVQDYSLGFSGGGTNSNFLISGGYFNQKGTAVGPKFERYSLRINSGFNRGKLRVGESVLLTRANQTRLNGATVTNPDGYPFVGVLRMLPVIPVYDPTVPGGYGIGGNNASTFGINPIAQQQLFNNTGTSNRLQGSIYGEYSFTDFLRYRLNLGTEFHAFHDREKRQFGVQRQNDPLNPSFYAENQGNELFTLVENTLTFDKSFDKNNLTAVVGYTEQRQRQEFTRGRNNDYGTGPVYYWALDAGSTAPQVVGSEYLYTKRSYLGQLTYDYDQRYLLTGAYRRDGSSRFSPDNRWGNFYAGSLGWRVSREAFFEGITAISNLKLRASYGSLGNESLLGEYGGSYLWQALINPNVNYPLGGDATIFNGSIQTKLASTDIAWEERRTTNVGADFGFLEDRLTLSLDYYVSKTQNALVQVQQPLVLGNAGDDPFRRIGRLENRGFEVLLGYNETRNPFKYGIAANLTTIKNEVQRLSDRGSSFLLGGPNDATRTEPGYEVGSFYLYQFDGIFQTGDNIAGSAQPNAQPGDVRYKDINNDGVINDRDRAHVGRVFPKLQYGLNLTASYANFDLAAFFQGIQGNDVLNVSKYWLERTDENGNYERGFSPWTPDNPSTTTPRAIISGAPPGSPAAASATENSRLNSTRWLEDGSYLRLKNIQIGYNVPKAALERVKGIGSLRIYVTGQNVFTVTDYSGYDPETVGTNPVTLNTNNPPPSTLARGVDFGSYPSVRTFAAGIQLGF